MNAHQRRKAKRVAAFKRRAQDMGISAEEFTLGLRHLASVDMYVGRFTPAEIHPVAGVAKVKDAVDQLVEVLGKNRESFFKWSLF